MLIIENKLVIDDSWLQIYISCKTNAHDRIVGHVSSSHHGVFLVYYSTTNSMKNDSNSLSSCYHL